MDRMHKINRLDKAISLRKAPESLIIRVFAFRFYHSFRQYGFFFAIENGRNDILFRRGNVKKRKSETCVISRHCDKSHCAVCLACNTNANYLRDIGFSKYPASVPQKNGLPLTKRSKPKGKKHVTNNGRILNEVSYPLIPVPGIPEWHRRFPYDERQPHGALQFRFAPGRLEPQRR